MGMGRSWMRMGGLMSMNRMSTFVQRKVMSSKSAYVRLYRVADYERSSGMSRINERSGRYQRTRFGEDSETVFV